MRLTTKSEYSLLALIYLARQADRGFIRLNEISARCDIPRKYLQQLFITLQRAHLLKTRRGVGGGYALARPAHVISIARIIRLLDGPLAATPSVSTYFFLHTPLEKQQKLLRVLKEIRYFTARRLEQLKLADLV